MSTAVYLLNRASTQSLRGLTPYKAWIGRKPSIEDLRIFGLVVHVKCTQLLRRSLKIKALLWCLLDMKLALKPIVVLAQSTPHYVSAEM